MSDATILMLATIITGCLVTLATIWARTRPGQAVEQINYLTGQIDRMHNTIVSQNKTINRQDEQWAVKAGDTHEFTQAEKDRAAGLYNKK